MSSSQLSYKKADSDLTIPISVVLILLLIWGVLFILGKKGKLPKLVRSDFHQPDDMKVVSKVLLPRGGLLLKAKISDRYVYFVESNKIYTQIDLLKSQKLDSESISNE